jgi:GAF domain-containing protein
MEQGVAILGSDVPGSGNFNAVESLVTSQIRSLLCVPLTVFDKLIGCIYLDSTNPAARFDEDHLQLVTAIAGISAIALENARQLDWLRQENLRLNSEINLEHNLVGESPRMKEAVPGPGGADRIDGADRRGKRHRQRIGCASHSSQ